MKCFPIKKMFLMFISKENLQWINVTFTVS